MKVILLLVVSCLSLHQGKGAPTTAVYKFVKCNPEGDQGNCVTQQTREVGWNQLLPNKLPASAARFLDAKPVEDESPDWAEEDQKEWGDEEDEDEEEQFNEKKDEDEKQVEEEEDDLEEEENTEVTGERGESPVEDGSGAEEGFSGEGPQAMPADEGSGELWTEKEDLFKVGDLSSLRRFFPSRPLFDESKPEEGELREDHLLQP